MKRLVRVMCVDDEDDILEVVRLCLEMLGGLEVFCCHSGGEALEQISANRPDLILLDVMMPGMDGPATFLELQRSASGADIPVVFMTARVQSTETEQYMRMGASGVVAKPFDPATLSSDIELIWRNIQQNQERQPKPSMPVLSARD